MFPPGLYAFSLGGGALSGSLNFSLAAPDDFVDFSFPQHMATGIESQPTVLFSTNCTNCGFLFVTLDDAEISPDLPPGTTMFQLPMPLADGVYQLGVAAEVSQDSMPSFGADAFEYSAIFGDENRISFTVPAWNHALYRVMVDGCFSDKPELLTHLGTYGCSGAQVEAFKAFFGAQLKTLLAADSPLVGQTWPA